MNNARFSMRLPSETLAFAQRYAAQYDMSLTDLVLRYLDRLRDSVAAVAAEKPRRVRDISRYRGILKGAQPLSDSELDAMRFKCLSEKYA